MLLLLLLLVVVVLLLQDNPQGCSTWTVADAWRTAAASSPRAAVRVLGEADWPWMLRGPKRARRSARSTGRGAVARID